MQNLEDTFTITVIGNGIGASAGVIQGLISDAFVRNPSIAAGLSLAQVSILAVGTEAFSVVIAVQSGDPERIARASSAAIGSIALSAVGAIALAGAPGLAPAVIVAGLGGVGTVLGKQIWEHYKRSVDAGIAPPPTVVLPPGITDFDFWSVPGGITSGVDNQCNRNFIDAQNWVAPRDPLVLDLDNDGIEAVGINPAAPILFDMDGDGIKTATGWIKADDGMVVLDRNGNGLIDSGRELFGDSTVLTRGPRAGQNAANGYEALADLDINGDGAINSLDAAYASLRIWQDTNQDGISQASEMRTLSDADIASLSVAGQASNINLGNGNTQPFSGSFTRTTGQAGTRGAAALAFICRSTMQSSKNRSIVNAFAKGDLK